MNMSVLELSSITKKFPGVRALDGASLSMYPGQVHALVGANGAGKSTLVKIIAGILRPDSGVIKFRGERISIRNPAHARSIGISLVPQIPRACRNMTVAENVFLGGERKFVQHGVLRWRKLSMECAKLLEPLGVEIAPSKLVKDLSVPEIELVEIARALSFKSSILILDEPTAALTGAEKERLFAIINSLKAQNAAVIYISHRLEEIFEIADQYTVLRDGKVVSSGEVSEVTRDSLIMMMTGKELKVANRASVERHRSVKPVLELKDIAAPGLQNVSLTIEEDEVLGITGLIGSGKSALAKVLFGLLKPHAGEIRLGGNRVAIRSPRYAMKLGIGFIPAERLERAIFPHRSVIENLLMPSLDTFAKSGVINEKRARTTCTEMVKKLNIKTSSIFVPVMTLSGGNQQKLSIARWLVREPRLIIFEEPTQGIDVEAKQEVWNIIEELRSRDVSVVVISSDVNELLAGCTRIVTMFDGNIVASYSREDVTKEAVVAAAVGDVTDRGDRC